MNKKVFVCSMFVLILFIVSCNGRNRNKVIPKDSAHNEVNNNNVVQKEMGDAKDTVSNQSRPDIIAVSAKMEKQEKLTDPDYDCICDFLFDIFDRGKNIEGGEGIGYNMFKYFKNNQSNNSAFISYLDKKESSFKEKILKWLIQAMSIDISIGNYSNGVFVKYTYRTFIKDFSMFKNSVSAKRAFYECLRNQL